jgi:hypothetical protein
MTKRQFNRYMEDHYRKFRQKETHEARSKIEAYEAGYFKSLTDAAPTDMSDLEFNQVYQLCTMQGSEFNRRITGNPEADARINFAEARASLLAGNGSPASPTDPADPQNPLLGRRSRVPLGPKVNPPAPPRRKPEVKLPPDAAALLADTKARGIDVTDEEVQEAVSGPLPFSLSGKAAF